MKQVTTIILLFFFNIFLVEDVSAQKLIGSGKTWVFLMADDQPNTKPNNDMCLRIGNDTLISKTNYYKLMYSIGCNETNWRIKGYIRETDDSLVYYLPGYNSMEYLLYDFGIKVGDSVYSTPTPCRLDSVGKTPKGQKIYYLSGSYNFKERWIEGVGSESGLLMELITGGSQIFNCCLLNGEELFHHPFYTECYFVTGVSQLDQPRNLVKVFLNSTGSLEIIPLIEGDEGLFELYSVNGRLIVKKRIKGKDEFCVDQKGIFFYRFTNGKGEDECGIIVIK